MNHLPSIHSPVLFIHQRFLDARSSVSGSRASWFHLATARMQKRIAACCSRCMSIKQTVSPPTALLVTPKKGYHFYLNESALNWLEEFYWRRSNTAEKLWMSCTLNRRGSGTMVVARRAKFGRRRKPMVWAENGVRILSLLEYSLLAL